VNSFSSNNPENILYINLMKSIFNLVLFLIVIITLVIICNNVEANGKKKEVSKNPIIKNTKIEKLVIDNVPRSDSTIIFDYEKNIYDKVPESKNKMNLTDKYYQDLKTGSRMIPKYEPPKDQKNKEFYKNESSDQTIIYDSKLYEKQIHNQRTVPNSTSNELPKKISEAFDESITDFKTLIPEMKGKQSDLVSDGAFDLEAYNPDYILYDDEKPENGGKIPNLYGTVYGNDPLLETGCAKF